MSLKRESRITITQFEADGDHYCRQEQQLPEACLVKWFQVEGSQQIDLADCDQATLEREYQRSPHFDGWMETPIFNNHYHVVDLLSGSTWITQIRVSPDYATGGYYKWLLDPEGARIRLDMVPKRYLFKQVSVSQDEIRSLQDWTNPTA